MREALGERIILLFQLRDLAIERDGLRRSRLSMRAAVSISFWRRLAASVRQLLAFLLGAGHRRLVLAPVPA